MGIDIKGENEYGYRCYCPFHSESDASFSVNATTGYWKCFAGCGNGSFIYLMKRLGYPTEGFSLPYIPRKGKPRPKPRPPESVVAFYARTPSPHLLERGFDADIQQRFEIGWKADTRETIFPMRDYDGTLLAYVHSPGRGKYYYKGDERGSALFGVQLIYGWEGDLILCEGTTDVLRIWQVGGVPAVATLGVTLSMGQVEWIKKIGKPVTCLFDNDAAGNKGRRDIWKRLQGRVTVRFPSWLPHEKDPDDITSSARLQELLENTVPFPRI